VYVNDESAISKTWGRCSVRASYDDPEYTDAEKLRRSTPDESQSESLASHLGEKPQLDRPIDACQLAEISAFDSHGVKAMSEGRASTGVAARPGASVRVFGDAGVDDGNGPISIGGPKQRRLLALLVVQPGSTVHVDRLSECLWDDASRPDATVPALRTYVSRLRSALPNDIQEWIETGQGGDRFAGPPEAVEHQRFSMLRADATDARERNDPLAALGLLDEALALWRGEPFRELEDLDWARASARRWTARYRADAHHRSPGRRSARCGSLSRRRPPRREDREHPVRRTGP
jgi:DNA-binding winged helix-turn-helix (wHTH) protein